MALVLKKILVVDDDSRVRGVIRLFLSSRPGWVVCGEAQDGVESIELAKTKHPDVVLMDVSMPRMNGLEATRVLHQESPQIPVILVSQNDPHVLCRQAREVGARGYCTKSELARTLAPIIERAIEDPLPPQEPGMAANELESNPSVLTSHRSAAIVDSSDDAIISQNLDGVITSWNQNAERAFGFTAQEVIGKSIRLIIPKNRLEEDRDMMARIFRGGRVDNIKTVRRRKDDSLVDVSLSVSALKDASGSIIGASQVAHGVGERRRAERNTGLLAAIVDSSDDAIISKSLDGIITSWNHSAERILGYRAEEAIGKHITLIIPRERLAEEERIIQRLRAGERVDHFQTVRARKDGSLVDLSLTISPILDLNGRVVGASKVARDITAQIRADEALRESEERFRKLSESLENEVRARTHELEELSWHLFRAQDEERRHVARELHDSAGQTLTVLDLNLTQLASKVTEAAPELSHELEIVQETIQQLHRELRTASYLLHPPLLEESGLSSALDWYIDGLSQRSDLAITLEVSKGLGRLPREMELVIFRLVQECLTNIHRHSGSKTALICIWRDSDHVYVEVRDQGKGIPLDKLHALQTRGSGLGLRGMRERLRHFGARLEVESAGQGTCVSTVLEIPKSIESEFSDQRE